MKKTIILMFALLAMQWQCRTMAGNIGDDLGLKLRFGYNLGGTAPLGMPASIRSLDKFCLTPSFMAGGDAWMPIKNNFGVMAGLRVENKALNAEITTKMYHMEVKKGDSMLDGMYTGRVRQRSREWMITIPVEATYSIGEKVLLKAGPYMSVLLDKSFEGYVYDGYLRQTSVPPTTSATTCAAFSSALRLVLTGSSATASVYRPTSTGVSTASSRKTSRPLSKPSTLSTAPLACSTE